MHEVSAGHEQGGFISAEEAIAQIAAGRPIVVTDAEDRENEGDVVVAAQFATDEVITFMARHARGLVCLALPGERCDGLGLHLQPSSGESRYGTAFTASIEARDGVTTGISAQDRAETVRVAIDPASTAAHIVQPGHVFPLRARPGGILERPGHTEAAVDLAALAALDRPGGVICEILKDDGTMARVDDLRAFCAEHGLSMVTIEALTAYRRRTEPIVDRIASAELPTEHGLFRVVGFRERYTGAEHVALVHGDVDGADEVLARLHSACLTGDAFGSARCDCGGQLDDALARIAGEGRGVLVHLAQEGRGIGLIEKIRAYAVQDSDGLDTVDANLAIGQPADGRDFGVGAQILQDLGLRSVRLMTNNPSKTAALVEQGLAVTQEPHERHATEHNRHYLQTKRDRLGHQLTRAGHGHLSAVIGPLPRPQASAAADDRSWLPAVEMAV